jgi:hypothetical protein
MNKDEYLTGKDYHIQIIPLGRFISESEITLGVCKIRKLKESEKQIISNSPAFQLAWSEAFQIDLNTVSFVIESSLSDSLLAYDVISALRVFKAEAVKDLPHMTLHMRNGDIINVSGCQFWGSLIENGAAYTLSEEEAKKFEKFWNSFSKVLSFSYMRIAVDRFSYTYRKGFRGDNLVDYVIVLEALFSESSESIGSKLRYRIPIFVGIDTSTDARKKIRDYISTAYKIRSGIVHGSGTWENLIRGEMKKLSKKLDLGEINFSTYFLPEIREIVRMAIYRFVILTSHGIEKSSILQIIDDALLNGDAENYLRTL